MNQTNAQEENTARDRVVIVSCSSCFDYESDRIQDAIFGSIGNELSVVFDNFGETNEAELNEFLAFGPVNILAGLKRLQRSFHQTNEIDKAGYLLTKSQDIIQEIIGVVREQDRTLVILVGHSECSLYRPEDVVSGVKESVGQKRKDDGRHDEYLALAAELLRNTLSKYENVHIAGVLLELKGRELVGSLAYTEGELDGIRQATRMELQQSSNDPTAETAARTNASDEPPRQPLDDRHTRATREFVRVTRRGASSDAHTAQTVERKAVKQPENGQTIPSRSKTIPFTELSKKKDLPDELKSAYNTSSSDETPEKSA